MTHKLGQSFRLATLLTRRLRKTPENGLHFQIVRTVLINENSFSRLIPKRCLFSQPCLKKQTPSLPNLEPKGQTTAKTAVKTKLFTKFFDYIKGYEVILEKLLPVRLFTF